MRRFSIVILALFFSAFAYGAAIGAPVVSLGEYTTTPGGTVTAQITLSDSAGWDMDTYSFRVLLDLHPDTLSAANVQAGPATPAPAFFIGNVSAPNNRVDFFYSVFSPTPPKLTDGLLATFDITAAATIIGTGSFALNFDDVAFSNGITPVAVDEVDGKLTVAVVPIPSAILLLGGGLVSLFAARRRRS